MTSCKLIIKNVKKNTHDYFVYFLTLTLSISLFYAFNSITSQSAFNTEMSATRTLLLDQLDILLSTLSVLIAVVVSFLIIYANQFLLRRRKKELGIYMMLGMKKDRISRIFVGETLLIGIVSLIIGLILGVLFSQGLSLVSLKLFATDLSKFKVVFSVSAFYKTICCFAIIFFIVMIFNVTTISSVKLIDLLKASRKNETLNIKNIYLMLGIFFVSVTFIVYACWLYWNNGILPTDKNNNFQIASILLIVGMIAFFYSISGVVMSAIQSNDKVYLRGLNTFLVRQLGSKIRSNYLIMAVVCGLLVITICCVSVGISTALAMNELSKTSTPYDLNVVANIEIDGDIDVKNYLYEKNVDIEKYADKYSQISVYEADITYGELFAGQELELWEIDSDIPNTAVSVLSISDYNKALQLQGKEPISISDDEYLFNCNYKGTMKYVEYALENNSVLTLGGEELHRSNERLMQETYLMTSVGNNDRGTLIVSDKIAQQLSKDLNVLLVQYKSTTNTDDVLQKMIPIGLDETSGFKYAEKNMMYDMYYGMNALIVFLCCYLGLVFLLICATVLALKQLTETTDNISRYSLLKKLGSQEKQIHHTLFSQISVFFTIPLILAGVISAVLIQKAMGLVEEFMNVHVSTNIVFTIVLFLLVYGSYFFATYLSCKKMVEEN